MRVFYGARPPRSKHPAPRGAQLQKKSLVLYSGVMQCPIHKKTELKVTYIHPTVPLAAGRCLDCDKYYWWATGPFEPVVVDLWKEVETRDN